jgi:hypothetical protein
MPGFHPSQPESADNAADAALRDRARKLADDIELVGARVRVLANNSQAAGLSWCADRLNAAVRSLRRHADKSYPGPHPEPWRAHVMDLDTSARGLRDVGATDLSKGLAELCERLDRLNRDWPNFDAMTPRRLRAEVEAGAPGAAALLKAVEAAGTPEDCFI